MSETTTEKTKGHCTGCSMPYVLTAKGLVRKHLSRTGPGECDGSRAFPREYMENLELDKAVFLMVSGQTDEQRGDVSPGFYASFDSDGSCGHQITEGDLIQSDGENGYVCTDCIAGDAEHEHWYTWADDDDGHSGSFCECGHEQLPTRSVNDVVADSNRHTVPQAPDPHAREAESSIAAETVRDMSSAAQAPDPFTAPGARSDIPEDDTTVSGQPEPDRDRWGRYKIHGVAHTRATTFAKLGANTKAIEAWNERNVIVGLTLREDLLMMAQGKEVKRDRTELNSIAEQAKTAAGNKVAANIGTGYHSFTERVDAGLMTVDQVPERYRRRVEQYVDTMTAYGLTTRREWIERTTAVRADQVSAPLPVAGTLDRIVQLPDGSLCIADLKTGSDLSYGEMEIEVQLALYAHGVNTHGLFDWNTKTWETRDISAAPGITRLRVSTDIAIVIHLPAEGDGCTLYVANIDRGWHDAQKLGQLQSSLKTKNRFRTLTHEEIQPRPVQAPAPVQATRASVVDALQHFHAAGSKERLAELYQFALDSGKFMPAELKLLAEAGHNRMAEL